MSDYTFTRWERIPEWVGRNKFNMLAVIGGAVFVFLVGCAGYAIWQHTPAPIETGTVTDRDFTPAHWEDYQRPVTRTRLATRTVCSGGYGSIPQSCHTETYTETYTDYVWDTRWVDDDWDLTVHGCSNDPRGKEHCRNVNVDVSHATFDQCEPNSHWSRSHGCDLR